MTRPSSLPIAYHCSGFISREMAEGPVLTYQGDRSAALEGSAAHLLTADWLQGGEMTGQEAIDQFAVHGLECEAGILEWMAREALEFAARLCQGLKLSVETKHEGIFPGTPDAMALDRDNDRIVIIDFKFGRLRRPSNIYQLLGYATTQAAKHPWSETFSLFTIYPRIGEFDFQDVDRKQVEKFLGEMQAKTEEAKTRPNFTLGDHCTFCKFAIGCPAVKAALGQHLPEPDAAIPESIETGRALKGSLESWIDRFKAAQKAYVNQGEVTLPSGKKLYTRAQDFCKVTPKAKPFLLKKFSKDDLLASAKWTKAELVKLARDRATGKKKEAEEQFIKEALEAGALRNTPRISIEEM